MALNVVLGFVMFGVALDIRGEDFRRVLRSPKGPLIGLTAQFLLLPAFTFLLTRVISPRPSVALGMILVAACPGGNMSNFFTHHAKGNAALSVSMTAVSTVLAIGVAAVVENMNLVFKFRQPLGDGFVFGMVLPEEVQLAGSLQGQEQVEQGVVLWAAVGQMAEMLRFGEGEEEDGDGGGMGHGGKLQLIAGLHNFQNQEIASYGL